MQAEVKNDRKISTFYYPFPLDIELKSADKKNLKLVEKT